MTKPIGWVSRGRGCGLGDGLCGFLHPCPSGGQAPPNPPMVLCLLVCEWLRGPREKEGDPFHEFPLDRKASLDEPAYELPDGLEGPEDRNALDDRELPDELDDRLEERDELDDRLEERDELERDELPDEREVLLWRLGGMLYSSFDTLLPAEI